MRTAPRPMRALPAPSRGRVPAARRFIFVLFGGALAALAAGCSSLPATPASSANVAPRPVASSFTASGRVAARAGNSGGGGSARGFSGGFSWVHRPGDDTIELLTPLGQLAARLTMSAAGAEVEQADGKRTFTAEPERSLEETLGVALPLGALPYWLQGAPLKGAPFRAEADAKGRPSTLAQNGWQIQYTEYASDDVLAPPTRLQLNHGDVELRLIIGEWSSP